jgi:hypothetical protein
MVAGKRLLRSVWCRLSPTGGRYKAYGPGHRSNRRIAAGSETASTDTHRQVQAARSTKQSKDQTGADAGGIAHTWNTVTPPAACAAVVYAPRLTAAFRSASTAGCDRSAVSPQEIRNPPFVANPDQRRGCRSRLVCRVAIG